MLLTLSNLSRSYGNKNVLLDCRADSCRLPRQRFIERFAEEVWALGDGVLAKLSDLKLLA